MAPEAETGLAKSENNTFTAISGEFDFRYNARGISDGERTELAVKGTAGKRLMLWDSKRIS